MAEEEIHHADGRIEHPSVRSEASDASFRSVGAVLVGALVLAVVIFVSVWGFFNCYNDSQSALRKSPYPLAPAPAPAAPGSSRGLPPEPRLEQLDRLSGIETANVYRREAAKENVLESYGKTDDDGFIHVPVERAIQHLAGKLPDRKDEPPGAQHANGLVDSGAPNSGRLFREKPKWSSK